MLNALKKAINDLVDSVMEVSGKGVVLREEHIQDFLDSFEIQLLEADTPIETTERITKEIKTKLVGKRIEKREMLKSEIRKILLEIVSKECPNIFLDKRPVIILFVGPNGVGKTSCICKLAHLLKKSKKTSIIAASDTFRAGSIQQLEKLASKAGVKVVKHGYGADPAAVAYDAVSSAKARGIDFVLIDTAGRQETNEDLLNQLEKIKRVTNPDFTVFVGEATAGNTLKNQIERFKERIGVDFAIITKLDADVKGGGILSAFMSGIPVCFTCHGQGLSDIRKFDPEWFVDELL